MWPHRQQPTRLPHPWDSPGKNTGVGCHFLLQCMKVKSEKWNGSHSVVSDSLRPHGLQPTRLLHLWDFPGKSIRVGCHRLLQMQSLRWALIGYNWCSYKKSDSWHRVRCSQREDLEEKQRMPDEVWSSVQFSCSVTSSSLQPIEPQHALLQIKECLGF